MKFQTIYLSLLCFLAFASIWGCKDFVEINPPKNQIVTESVFSTNETANSAILTVYAQIFDNPDNSPYKIALYTGLASDEFTNWNNNMTPIYINKIDPAASTPTNTFWQRCYRMIYYANSIYEGCERSTTLDANVKKQIQGEALFVRAYWHFYLVNLFGDVPIVLTTDYNANSFLFRSPAPKVYQQIVADLKSAQNYLKENYVGPDGAAASTERVRPNKATATALLARVYLYTGDYISAEQEATTLISNTSQYSLVSLNQVFLKNNKEAIWQIMPANNSSYNTYDAAEFLLTTSPITSQKVALSSQLYNAFQNGDLRKTSWVGTFTVGTTPYYFAYKYKAPFASTSVTEYTNIFRLAEQYLIRAEARNEQNNIEGAVSDLNALRNRSRAPVSVDTPNPLPPILINVNKDELKLLILKERQVELFAEQGHRWLDLKRTNAVDAVMLTATATKGVGWKTTAQLWPLPLTEISNNPNLVQNPGYN